LIVQKDSQVKMESNSSVFKRRLNVVSDWTARSEDGREFQARAAATGNCRRVGLQCRHCRPPTGTSSTKRGSQKIKLKTAEKS